MLTYWVLSWKLVVGNASFWLRCNAASLWLSYVSGCFRLCSILPLLYMIQVRLKISWRPECSELSDLMRLIEHHWNIAQRWVHISLCWGIWDYEARPHSILLQWSLDRSPVKLSRSDGPIRVFALFNKEISVVNGPWRLGCSINILNLWSSSLALKINRSDTCAGKKLMFFLLIYALFKWPPASTGFHNSAGGLHERNL